MYIHTHMLSKVKPVHVQLKDEARSSSTLWGHFSKCFFFCNLSYTFLEALLFWFLGWKTGALFALLCWVLSRCIWDKTVAGQRENKSKGCVCVYVRGTDSFTLLGLLFLWLERKFLYPQHLRLFWVPVAAANAGVVTTATIAWGLGRERMERREKPNRWFHPLLFTFRSPQITAPYILFSFYSCIQWKVRVESTPSDLLASRIRYGFFFSLKTLGTYY